jgi:hypothetical protein
VTDRVVLDAGALIALERNERPMWARLAAAADAALDIVVPVGVLAQVWRGTPNQARLSQALARTRSGGFDAIARAAGELCHRAGSSDPIDAAVVLNAAGARSVIVTSDPDDMLLLVGALPREPGSMLQVVSV